jgi:hypothetical protein
MGFLKDAWKATGGRVTGAFGLGGGPKPEQVSGAQIEQARQNIDRGMFSFGGSLERQGELRGIVEAQRRRGEGRQVAGSLIQGRGLGDSISARRRQESAADRLEARAEGRAPSLAAAQAEQGADRAIRNQFALANSGRGNPGASARVAANNAAQIQADTAQAAAQGRIAEQQAAEGQLAGALGNIRSQDLSTAQQGLQTQSLGAQQEAQGIGSTLATEQQIAAGRRAYEQQAIGLATGNVGIVNQKIAQDQAAFGNILGAGAGAATAAVSDIRAKEDIRPARSELREMVEALTPAKYKYKDEERDGKGEQYGVMAQDLERTEAGKEFVSEDEEGVKRVNYGKMLPAIVGIIADMNDRLERREQNG